MGRSHTKDLTHGSPMKLVIAFTAPLLFGFLFQQLYSFVDTAIVGRFLGASALAAVGSTGSLNFLILGFCMGCCSGFSIPIAQAFGAKDETELRRCVMNAAYLSGFISVVMGVATALASPAMLHMMNTPADILHDANAYIQPIFAAIPITVLYNMASGVLRSLGDSKTPVVFLTIAALLNIVLDVVFIVVCGMGVAGAAWATIISQAVSGVGCLVVMIRKFPILKMHRDDLRLRRRYQLRLFSMGVPMGLQYAITAIGSVVIQMAINGLGTQAVAAVSAGFKLSGLYCCVIDALATTMATFAGQNVGARKVHRIRQGLKASSVIGILYCIIAFLTIWLFGDKLIGLFVESHEAEVISMAHRFLIIISAFYVPLLFVNIVRFTIQGMGFTSVAMIAGVMEMIGRSFVAIVLVPLAGFTAACFAHPAAWIMADLFLFPCYFYVEKKLSQKFRCDSPTTIEEEVLPMLKKIASFTINHDVLVPGMYVSRIDGDCVTYDLRLKLPNAGDYLEQGALHTLEHLVATFVRSSSWSDQVVYFGPMGCRTGFYLILRDSVSREDAIRLTKDAFAFSAAFEVEIPGAKKIECGNYLDHNLEGAKAEAAAYVKVLEACTPETMVYPE